MDLTNIYDESLRDALRALEFRQLNHLCSNPVLAVGTDTDEFKVSAFSYKLGGVTYNKAAEDDIATPASTNSASQYSKDLIVIDAAQAITVVAGEKATSQLLAELPDTPADKLAIGYIEVPNSFTPGTTDVTSGMLKNFVETVDVTYGND